MGRIDQKVFCNYCGKLICPESEKDKHSFLAIKKEWGYFSDGKDGKVYSVDICEKCCEKLAETFAIPPEIHDITEFV